MNSISDGRLPPLPLPNDLRLQPLNRLQEAGVDGPGEDGPPFDDTARDTPDDAKALSEGLARSAARLLAQLEAMNDALGKRDNPGELDDLRQFAPRQLLRQDARRRARAPSGKGADVMLNAIGQRDRDEIVGLHAERNQPPRTGGASCVQFGPAQCLARIGNRRSRATRVRLKDRAEAARGHTLNPPPTISTWPET